MNAGNTMSRRSAIKAGAALGFGLAGLKRGFAAEGPVAETALGKVRGEARERVHVFKGVRYAGSTAGANRFRPAPAATPWAGIADATAFGASAPQTGGHQAPLYAWYGAIQPVSEDCLFLNVFTPGLADAARRPVMVWLHGGSWTEYAGTAPDFDGTNLADTGDVVVVTVNHRLNLFGYLQLDDEDERFADSGNAGMLDLVAALKWVRDNAASFGGDPNNVTIFGQSGGAAKVLALMGMPAASGLFHKAIVESCSGGMRITGREEAAKQAHALAAVLGVPRLDGAALQKMPVEQLIAANKQIADPFRPVIDGRNFIRDPFFPSAPEQSSIIPLMIGNAATETTYYLAVEQANFSLDMPEVQKRLGRFLHLDAAQSRRLIDAYLAEFPAASATELLTTITTDYVFKRNTLRAAQLQAAQASAPVFGYVFSWRTPIMGGVMGTPHTSEVPFVFGSIAAAEAMVGAGPDLAPLSKIMMATWSSFARAGNPNNPLLPPWPRYTDATRLTMMLNLEADVVGDPGGKARQALDGLPYYEYSMPRSAFMHAEG